MKYFEIGDHIERYANPAYITLGYLYKHLDIDPSDSVLILALFNAVLFVWAAYLFFGLHFNKKILPYIIFAMLFLRGGLFWAGAYSTADAYDFFYPKA